MSYEGQAHHPHKRGYPPSSDLLLDSQSTVPRHLDLVQAHWFVRHGERSPVRQRMAGLGDIPPIFSLCSVGRNFTSAVLSLAPLPGASTPPPNRSSLGSSPSPSNPFLASTRHTTSSSSAPRHADACTAPLDPIHRQMPVTRFTEDVPAASASTVPTRGGLSDCYWGELTDLGRESTLRFGSILRRLYTGPSSSSFLAATLDSESLECGVVRFRSTNMPRTIESLHQIIQGLYPPEARDSTVRIPYAVRNWMDENLYPNTACKRLRQLDAASIQSAAQRSNPSLATLDDVLVPVLGKPLRIDSSPRANGVLDTLMVCRAHGIEVPRVFDDRHVLETLEKGVVHEWFDGYMNPEFRKLAMGRLFSDLHTHLSMKTSDPASSPLKLAINSCHDTSIGGILNALDAFNGRWPPFTSSVGIELYQDRQSITTITNDDENDGASRARKPPQSSSSLTARITSLLPSSSGGGVRTRRPRHFVRVLFNGEALVLPGCKDSGNHLDGTDGKFCTFEAFEQVLEKVEMGEGEWKEACGSD